MNKQRQGEWIVIETGFDYSMLEARLSGQVRAAAHRIRESLQRTLTGLIEVGGELRAVKAVLGHGQFGQWLRAEFGWTDRTARNLMAVSMRFGAKTEMISEMRIDPTAAYLLAAPSAPEEARETALRRAEAGERITASAAREILARVRKSTSGRLRLKSTQELGERLAKALGRFRTQWDARRLAELARQLRLFADEIEAAQAANTQRPRWTVG